MGNMVIIQHLDTEEDWLVRPDGNYSVFPLNTLSASQVARLSNSTVTTHRVNSTDDLWPILEAHGISDTYLTIDFTR